MPPDPIDLSLRSHFAGQLDRQRGRAGAAFAAAVSHPATIALARRERHRPLRTATGIGLALAASIALGFAIPAALQRPAGPAAPAGPIATGTQVPTLQPTVVSNAPGNAERSTFNTTVDAGTVMIDPNTPGRMIRRTSVEQRRWRDADGREHVEQLEPAEQILVVPMQRQ